jgi:hypothetical protein
MEGNNFGVNPLLIPLGEKDLVDFSYYVKFYSEY